MAEHYEFFYFPFTGRGELVRQTFAAAGVPYQDNRVKRSEWPELKATGVSPSGQMPFLKVAGKGVLSQSLSIARFIAREHGLAGDSSFDQANVDMVMQTVEDLSMTFISAQFEKNEDTKAEKFKKIYDETLPNTFQKLNDLAGENYFVGNKLSAADVHFHVFSENRKDYDWTPYPSLIKIIANVKANPGVKAWLEKRPESDWSS